MVKGNESDVTNIDFELQTERSNKFICLGLQRSAIISATKCLLAIRFGWGENEAFQMDK